MTTKHVKKSKTWNVALWILQVLVGGMFLAVGLMKTFTPIEELAKTVPLAGDLPALIRFIGISELLGAIGLLLPGILRIRPRLTILAASGLAIVMVLAFLYHLVRSEFSAIGTVVVLGALATLIAWGRLHKAPIHSRMAHARQQH